jgi:hypothetical protein
MYFGRFTSIASWWNPVAPARSGSYTLSNREYKQWGLLEPENLWGARGLNALNGSSRSPRGYRVLRFF